MISKLEIALVKTYQIISHPVYKGLKKVHLNLFECRHTPNCSEYAIEALRKYGAVKGTKMAMQRIKKCNPNFPGGYNPVE